MNSPNPMPPPIHDQNQQSPDSRAQKINTVWKIVSYIYTFAALGLCIYWEFPDPNGLNEYIYDFQLSVFKDSYYPYLDVMISLLVLVIPLFIVKIIVEQVTGVKIERINYRRR